MWFQNASSTATGTSTALIDHLSYSIFSTGALGSTANTVANYTSDTTDSTVWTGSIWAGAYNVGAANIPEDPMWRVVYQTPPLANYFIPASYIDAGAPPTMGPYIPLTAVSYPAFSCLAPDAEEKAEKLLCEVLSGEQREEYKKEGHFYVRSRSGKLYQVTKGISKNVYQVSERGGKRERCFCIHPSKLVPKADVMIAQKLLLEADEETFLKTANEWPVAA